MLESIGLFFAGWLLTWPALIILFALGILFEHNGARGWAVFAGLVSMAVAYFFFAVPFTTVLMGAAGYIVVGVIYSYWRYKRQIAKVIAENIKSSSGDKERALVRLHPKQMLPTITAWILIWPFSFAENFVGDILTALQLMVSKVFRGLYHKAYESAVSALK